MVLSLSSIFQQLYEVLINTSFDVSKVSAYFLNNTLCGKISPILRWFTFVVSKQDMEKAIENCRRLFKYARAYYEPVIKVAWVLVFCSGFDGTGSSGGDYISLVFFASNG